MRDVYARRIDRFFLSHPQLANAHLADAYFELRAIAAGYSWYDPDELRHGIGVFLELCREHIQLEESIIYPQAKAVVAKLERRRALLPPLKFKAGAPSSS